MSNPVPDGGLFAALMVKHDRRLLRYIFTLLPHRADAEEVLQQTATVLWEHFHEFDTTRDFYPWAVRFAYFEVLNHRKERARDRLLFCEDVIQKLAETREDNNDLLERRREALVTCLDQLPPADAELLRRRYCLPHSMVDLATEWSTTVKALYRRIDRLRERLAECISRKSATAAEKKAHS